MRARSEGGVASAAFFPGARDQARDAVEILRREIAARLLEQGRNDLGDRAVEEGGHQMIQSILARLLAIERGAIDVARAVILVAQQAFVLENAQRGADRRVAGWIGNGVHDLAGGGL